MSALFCKKAETDSGDRFCNDCKAAGFSVTVTFQDQAQFLVSFIALLKHYMCQSQICLSYLHTFICVELSTNVRENKMVIFVWRKGRGGMTENSNATMLEVISFQRENRNPGHVHWDVSPEQSTEHVSPFPVSFWHGGYDKPSLSPNHNVQLPHSYCQTRFI